MLTINQSGKLNENISLTRSDMRLKIKINSKTNKGIVKNITTFGHFVMDDNSVVGDWREVIEIDDVFYFL